MAEDIKVEVQPETEALEEQVVQTEQVVQEQEVEAQQPAQEEVAVAAMEEGSDTKESWLSRAGAAIKEWARKKVVGLKRSPQTITLVALFITTALWLIWLFTFSKTIDKCSSAEWCGLVVFVNTLVSILILALFGSAFPKRKKPSIVFIALLFVFMALIIVCDVVYYVQMKGYIYGASNLTASDLKKDSYVLDSLTLAIVHMVLIGVCALLLATLPLYKRLINMINTKKEVASNEIKEVIDVEED